MLFQAMFVEIRTIGVTRGCSYCYKEKNETLIDRTVKQCK